MSPEKDKHSTALVKSGKAIEKHAAKKTLAKKDAGKKHPEKPHPKKYHDKHGQHDGGKDGAGKGAKDLRRAYEHLARVRVLLAHGGGEPKLRAAAERLAGLVTDELRGENAAPKLAAELSRAAEHIAFAGLVAHDAKRLPWSPRIEAALDEEFRKKRGDAEIGKPGKHTDARAEAIRTLHALMSDAAQDARAAKNHTKAMECVRAAESLAAAIDEAE